MNERYKLYGKPVEISSGYFEVPYKEYRGGELVGIGTEDFTWERLRKIAHITYEVWEESGRQNKGGQMMHDCYGYYHFRTNNDKAARKVIREKLRARYAGRKIKLRSTPGGRDSDIRNDLSKL